MQVKKNMLYCLISLVNRANELSARGENIKDLDEAIKKLL